MTDEQKRQMLDDVLDRVGMDGIGQLVLEQNNTFNIGREQPVQMPPSLSRERAVEIYNFLIGNGYIDQQTQAYDFLYLMGVTATAPLKLKPINWLTTVQQLRRMLELTFSEPLERGSLKKAELERRAPYCFLNKGKKMKELAKPSTEFSLELDKLEDFFRPKSE
jgi:hypothetical protein